VSITQIGVAPKAAAISVGGDRFQL